MTITKRTNISKDTINGLITFFRDKPNIRAKMESYAIQFKEIEDVFFELLLNRWIDNGEGVQLDKIGKIVNEVRAGKNDENYRLALKGRIKLNKSNATVNDLLDAMTFITEDDYEFRPLSDATFKIRKMGLVSPTIEPIVYGEALDRMSGGGIAGIFEYAESEENDTFRWSTTDSFEVDSRGFGNDAGTTGGERTDTP